MSEMKTRISITGDPGSGKSTFAKSVADFTGYEMITTGNIFRKLAAERGISITRLNEMAEMQKELDAKVDDYLVALNETKHPMVLDSRMAWHFVRGTFKVRLTVDPDVAVDRIFKDTAELREKFSSLEEAMEEVEKRKQSEIRRYQKLYGVNIGDDTNFDLVINTSHISKEEALRIFKDAYTAAPPV
ncbi:MAG: cytidylate kinase family protein [Rhodospirillales bacterium]|nr:cytidylate kinase family protein [Rhodospirillales bacterium]MCB9972978.1 cytidylate kinase family protein [Rhodospirillales bacterium]MCB9980034.1 cytidylate kinase family protein [Rhodospirillales bacterium]